MPRSTLTPTILARAATCPHSWYLETHVDAELQVEPDAGMELLFEAGREHERQMVASLDNPVQPDWDRRDFEAGQRATLALMEQGVEWIYQAPLCRDDVRGVPDLLKRVDGKSALGGHSYVPVDIKGHQAVNKKDRLQLHAYAWMLEAALGNRPGTGGIWLNTGQIDYVDLSGRLDEFGKLYQGLHAIRAGKAETVPVRCGECGMCPWSQCCAEEWQRTRSVTLLAGGTGRTAHTLIQAGYTTWPDVAATRPDVLAAATGFKLDKATRLQQAAEAWRSGVPELLQPVT
ncbi:MAG: TM0106 family RecB-like putative nuclease, partial [Gammaproteobacteria bacterium]|nr:TM0106 family RecB-like putative nuclease [Gammaproteobacteria bacterium]